MAHLERDLTLAPGGVIPNETRAGDKAANAHRAYAGSNHLLKNNLLTGAKKKIWKREFVAIFTLLFGDKQTKQGGKILKNEDKPHRPKMPPTLENLSAAFRIYDNRFLALTPLASRSSVIQHRDIRDNCLEVFRDDGIPLSDEDVDIWLWDVREWNGAGVVISSRMAGAGESNQASH
ncbi:unnamed protein product [Lepidochelys olivacea]